MLTELEKYGQRVCIPANQPICEAGKRADYFYGLISGSALRYIYNPAGQLTVFEKLRPPNLFGFEVLKSLAVEDTDYSFSVKALEDCQVLKIPGCGVRELVRDPGIALAIMIEQAERDSSLQVRQSMFSSRTSLARLAMILLEFADYDETCNLVVNNISGEELGGAIGATREQTNHSLTKLKKAGFVSTHFSRGYRSFLSTYTILDVEGLTRVAQERGQRKKTIPVNIPIQGNGHWWNKLL